MISEILSGELKVLGKGGRGTIYTNPQFPQYVIKESLTFDKCRGWNKEYQTLYDINEKLQEEY